MQCARVTLARLSQGLLSFLNDAVVTFGYHVAPGRTFWVVADRCCACCLTGNAIGTAYIWSLSAQDRTPRWLPLALVLSFVFYLPSKAFELAGDMRTFLLVHSIWHYLPNTLAILWLSSNCVGRFEGRRP